MGFVLVLLVVVVVVAACIFATASMCCIGSWPLCQDVLAAIPQDLPGGHATQHDSKSVETVLTANMISKA